jgi:hypothetical protein
MVGCYNDVGESGEDEIRTRAGILLYDEMKLLSYLRRCDRKFIAELDLVNPYVAPSGLRVSRHA